MLLVANVPNTKWCNIFFFKWLNPWFQFYMATYLRVCSESYPMNTNMTGFRWFSSLFLEESNLSIWRVNITCHIFNVRYLFVSCWGAILFYCIIFKVHLLGSSFMAVYFQVYAIHFLFITSKTHSDARDTFLFYCIIFKVHLLDSSFMTVYFQVYAIHFLFITSKTDSDARDTKGLTPSILFAKKRDVFVCLYL